MNEKPNTYEEDIKLLKDITGQDWEFNRHALLKTYFFVSDDDLLVWHVKSLMPPMLECSNTQALKYSTGSGKIGYSLEVQSWAIRDYVNRGRVVGNRLCIL
jgi:hypothetical protein